MLRLQDSVREFRGRSRPLLEFLKKSVQYGRRIDQPWLEDNANAYFSKVRDFDRLRFNGHTTQIITEEKWELFL
jgi:hypothetical protein